MDDVDEERRQKPPPCGAKETWHIRIEATRWIRGGKVVQGSQRSGGSGDTSPWGWGKGAKDQKGLNRAGLLPALRRILIPSKPETTL